VHVENHLCTSEIRRRRQRIPVASYFTRAMAPSWLSPWTPELVLAQERVQTGFVFRRDKPSRSVDRASGLLTPFSACFGSAKRLSLYTVVWVSPIIVSFVVLETSAGSGCTGVFSWWIFESEALKGELVWKLEYCVQNAGEDSPAAVTNWTELLWILRASSS
jgi:hypothetical protein